MDRRKITLELEKKRNQEVVTGNEFSNDENMRDYLKKYEAGFHKIFKKDDYEEFYYSAKYFYKKHRSFRKRLLVDKTVKMPTPPERVKRRYSKDINLTRLCLGIAIELALKSLFLYNGYLINEVNNLEGLKKIGEVPQNKIKKKRLRAMGYFTSLWRHMPQLKHLKEDLQFEAGLKLAKFWRDSAVHNIKTRIQNEQDQVNREYAHYAWLKLDEVLRKCR